MLLLPQRQQLQQHHHRRRRSLKLSTSCSPRPSANLCRRRHPHPSSTSPLRSAKCVMIVTRSLSLMSVLITCVILLTSLIPPSLSQGVCPSKCNCIWRNGKQTTVCESQGLISIPSGIAQQTQVLNLNQNNFQILPAKVFQERGLINLQKVFLSRCKLGVIAEDAFVQLTNLVELDLSSNVLTSVPSDSLKHCPNLRRLVLNNNPIGAIAKDTFASTPSLNSLDLSECQIGSVEAGAFKGLSSLQYLKLDGNRLSTMSSLVLQDLPPLYSMDLHKNPWNCDCALRPAREWMIRYNVPQSIPPTCAGPDKRSGMMWNSLELDEFACSPQILSRDTEITAMIASNASFTCITRAQPEAKVSWLIEDVIYRNLSSSSSAMNRQAGGERFSFSEDRSAGPSLVSSTLTITNLEAGDSGKTFVCYAENFAGVASKSFTISVLSLSGTVVGGWSKVEIAVAIVTAVIVLLSVFIAITIFIVRSRRFKDCNSSTGSTAKPSPIVHASDHSSKASIPQIDVLKNVPSHGTPSPLGSNKEILESNGHIVNFNNFSSSLHHYNSRDDILSDHHHHQSHPHHLSYGNNAVVDYNNQLMDPVTGYLQQQHHLQQQMMQQQQQMDQQQYPQTVSPSQQMFNSAMIMNGLMFQNNGMNTSSSTGSSNPPTGSGSSHFDNSLMQQQQQPFANNISMNDIMPETNIPVSGTCVICEQPFADLRFHYMDYHQVRECIV